MKRRDFMGAVGIIAGFGMKAIPTRAQGQLRRIGVLALAGPLLLEEPSNSGAGPSAKNSRSNTGYTTEIPIWLTVMPAS